jgi:ribosomal protein L7Ae-like RNA K-turn-binding protein
MPSSYEKWLNGIIKGGIKVVILSSDFESREPIANYCKRKGIKYIYDARKPFAHGHLLDACVENNVSLNHAAIVDENFLAGGVQSALTKGGLTHYWPPPLFSGDSRESKLFCKVTRFISRVTLGWMAKPF